jgi:hypothetical protein
MKDIEYKTKDYDIIKQQLQLVKDKLKDNEQELNVMKQKENTIIIDNKK